jgi:hypothetical protein
MPLSARSVLSVISFIFLTTILIGIALAPVALNAAERNGGEQGGEEEMTEKEASALLAAGNQAMRESNETPSRAVDAALAFIKVLPYYKKVGQTDMVVDIEAAVFWAKKRMNIDDVNRFLAAKGGSAADIALLASADQVANRAVSLEEAQLYFDRAEKFATDNPSALGRIAARWYEVAERFVGTEIGKKAHDFSLAAQKKDSELLALERTAKSETIFSQPEIIYDTSTLIKPPSEPEIKVAILALKKERKEYFAKRRPSQIMKLIKSFIDEAKNDKLASDRRMALIRSAMDMSVDINDLHQLFVLGEIEASIFSGAGVRDRQRAALQLKRMNPSVTAIIKLFDDPQDADANLQAGRYYCLDIRRWDDGIPMLARSSDKYLKDIAGMELIRPEGWMQQVELGDRWFAAMKKSYGPAKQSMAIRSHYWYSRAKPQLSGITQLRITQQLEDLAEYIPLDQVNFETLTAKQWDRLPVKPIDVLAEDQRQDVGLVLKKGMTVRVVPHPSERWTMDYHNYTWRNIGNVFDTNALGLEGEENNGRTIRGENKIRLGCLVMTLEKHAPVVAGVITGEGRVYLGPNMPGTGEGRGKIRVKILMVDEE